MPQTPTWEDTVEVPAWEDTAPESQPSEVKAAPLIKLSPYEQANLESMMAGRGKLPTGMEAGTELVTAIAEDPERFLQTPLVPIPRIEAKSTLGKIAAAPVNVAGGLIQGMETPLGVLTLGLGGPIAKAAFAGLAAKSAGEQLGTASVTGDPGQITEGLLGAALGPAIALHRTLPTRPGPVQGPLATGEVLQPPIGARAPRVEAPLIERTSPEQAARLADLMTREAETGMYRRGNVQPMVPRLPRPVIPETAPEPAREINVAQEEKIGRMLQVQQVLRAQARTTAEVQKLFPEMNRQQAAQLRREAWEEQPQAPPIQTVRRAATTAEILGKVQALRPAVKTMDGEVVAGDKGQSHNDIIEQNKIPATDVDKREFVDQKTGQELSREQVATAIPTEKPGEAHSSDLTKAQEAAPAPEPAAAPEAVTAPASKTELLKQDLGLNDAQASELLAAKDAWSRGQLLVQFLQAKGHKYNNLSQPQTGHNAAYLEGLTDAAARAAEILKKPVHDEGVPQMGGGLVYGPNMPKEVPDVNEFLKQNFGWTDEQIKKVFASDYEWPKDIPFTKEEHAKHLEAFRTAQRVQKEKFQAWKSKWLAEAEQELKQAPPPEPAAAPKAEAVTPPTPAPKAEPSGATPTPVQPKSETQADRQFASELSNKYNTPPILADIKARQDAVARAIKSGSRFEPYKHDNKWFIVDAQTGTRTEAPVVFNHPDLGTIRTGRIIFKTKKEAQSAANALESPTKPTPPAAEPQAPPAAQGPGMVGPGAQTAGEPQYPAISQLTDQLNQTPKAGLKDSIQLKERVAEQWARGKSTVNRAVARMRAVTESLKDTARGVRTPTELDRKVGQFDWAVQSSAGRSKQAGQAIRRQMPSQTMREAVAIWIDAGGDVNVIREAIANLPEGTRPSVRRAMEQATNLSPEARDFAESLRQFYGIRENDAVSHELFEQGLKDYYTHIWEKEENMPDELRAAFVNGKLSTYFQFARQRKLPTFLEGILLGKTPKLDPAEVIPFYNYAMDRAIASRQFIKDASEVVMPDGRPLLSPSGTRSVVAQGETPDALLIKPKARSEQNADYHQVDHPALRKWKWAGTGESGEPILYQGDLLVHPEGFTRLANMMDRGRLTPSKWGGRLLRLSTEVKGMKLGMLSAFHNIHVGSHAAFHWTNPFKALGKPIDWDAPETRFAVEKGHLKIGPDPAELRIASEGILSPGLIHKFPIIGPISKAWSEWTFGEMIPQLKMATFKNAYDRNLWARDHLPNALTGLKGLTNEEVAARVGDSVNNAFGELNHLFLGKYGRNPQFQRILRGIFLAPDFGEARLRFAEKAFTKAGFEERLALATMFTTLYLGARVANWLSHGDPEWDWKKAFAVKAGDHWWSMRSVVGDIDHAASDFGRFMYVRLNPLYSRTAADFLFGRDISGRKLTTSQKIGNVFKQLIPIQMGGLTRDDQRLWESFVGAMGLSTQRDRPEGDINKLVADWMSKSTDPKIQLKHQQREGEVFAQSAYAPMRFALEAEDYGKAAEEYQKLLKAKTFSQIDKALNRNLDSMGGLTKPEFRKFLASLTPPQRKLYEQAKANRREIHNRFLKMLAQSK